VDPAKRIDAKSDIIIVAKLEYLMHLNRTMCLCKATSYYACANNSANRGSPKDTATPPDCLDLESFRDGWEFAARSIAQRTAQRVSSCTPTLGQAKSCDRSACLATRLDLSHCATTRQVCNLLLWLLRASWEQQCIVACAVIYLVHYA
jgi:hypothetical protein